MKSSLFTAGIGGLVLVLSGCPREDAVEPAVERGIRAEPGVAPPDVEPTLMRELDRDPPSHLVYRPEDIEWQDGPGSFEAGSQFVILEGDLAEPGVFTARFRLPDGFVINPHTHPNVERVTVLQGTFRLGHGETVDAEAAEELPAGSYTSMPKGMVHHAIAEGETIIQLTSVGPWEIEYLDPAHDPRLRGEATR